MHNLRKGDRSNLFSVCLIQSILCSLVVNSCFNEDEGENTLSLPSKVSFCNKGHSLPAEYTGDTLSSPVCRIGGFNLLASPLKTTENTMCAQCHGAKG